MNKKENQIEKMESKIAESFDKIKGEQKNHYDLRKSLVNLKNKKNLSHVGKYFKKDGQYIKIVGLNIEGDLEIRSLRFEDGGSDYPFSLGELDIYTHFESSFAFFIDWDSAEITEKQFIKELTEKMNKLLLKEFSVDD